MGEVRRAAVVSRQPATLRQVQQALGVAGLSMRQVIGPSFLPRSARGEFDVVIVDLDVDPDREPAELVTQAAQACPETPLIALAGTNARHRLPKALAEPAVIGIVPKIGVATGRPGAPAEGPQADGPDELELAIALRRLVQRSPDVPAGPLPYVMGGMPIEERVVGSTDEKEKMLAEVLEYGGRLGLSDEKLRRVEVVTDELLMNAIYNAPRDLTPSGSGSWQPVPRYATFDRRTPLNLSAKEQVRLRWSTDGRTFAVSVNDRFGALTRQLASTHIQRILEARGPQARKGAGGAGLGLMVCYQTANQMIFHAAPGRFTEVTGVIHIAGQNRKANERGCAVYLYCL